MALVKITDNDLDGKGVMPLADVPGLSAEAMKAKFEQIVREVVIMKFNAAIDELNDFLFLGGNNFLKSTDVLGSYASVLANTDPKKIPNAIATKEMDAALKSMISGSSNPLYVINEDLDDIYDETKILTYEVTALNASESNPVVVILNVSLNGTIVKTGSSPVVGLFVDLDGNNVSSVTEKPYATTSKVISFNIPVEITSSGNHVIEVSVTVYGCYITTA